LHFLLSSAQLLADIGIMQFSILTLWTSCLQFRVMFSGYSVML